MSARLAGILNLEYAESIIPICVYESTASPPGRDCIS
jgi:hypothetical protein